MAFELHEELLVERDKQSAKVAKIVRDIPHAQLLEDRELIQAVDALTAVDGKLADEETERNAAFAALGAEKESLRGSARLAANLYFAVSDLVRLEPVYDTALSTITEWVLAGVRSRPGEASAIGRSVLERLRPGLFAVHAAAFATRTAVHVVSHKCPLESGPRVEEELEAPPPQRDAGW